MLASNYIFKFTLAMKIQWTLTFSKKNRGKDRAEWPRRPRLRMHSILPGVQLLTLRYTVKMVREIPPGRSSANLHLT